MNFEKLLKFLHGLVFIIGLSLLAWPIYLNLSTWPRKPAFDFKILWIAVDVGLFITFLFLLNKARGFRPHINIKKRPPAPLTPEKKAALNFWCSIREKAFSGNLDQMKLAIIEADKFVGQALTNVGFSGENTGDKINQIMSEELGWIRRAGMKAHEYHNRIVDDPNFEIDSSDVKKTIHNFEVILKELELINPADL